MRSQPDLGLDGQLATERPGSVPPSPSSRRRRSPAVVMRYPSRTVGTPTSAHQSIFTTSASQLCSIALLPWAPLETWGSALRIMTQLNTSCPIVFCRSRHPRGEDQPGAGKPPLANCGDVKIHTQRQEPGPGTWCGGGTRRLGVGGGTPAGCDKQTASPSSSLVADGDVPAPGPLGGTGALVWHSLAGSGCGRSTPHSARRRTGSTGSTDRRAPILRTRVAASRTRGGCDSSPSWTRPACHCCETTICAALFNITASHSLFPHPRPCACESGLSLSSFSLLVPFTVVCLLSVGSVTLLYLHRTAEASLPARVPCTTPQTPPLPSPPSPSPDQTPPPCCPGRPSASGSSSRAPRRSRMGPRTTRGPTSTTTTTRWTRSARSRTGDRQWV